MERHMELRHGHLGLEVESYHPLHRMTPFLSTPAMVWVKLLGRVDQAIRHAQSSHYFFVNSSSSSTSTSSDRSSIAFSMYSSCFSVNLSRLSTSTAPS